MRTICKFEFEAIDTAQVSIPVGFKILHVGVQRPRAICVWAEVDSDNVPVEVNFRIVGTGHPTDRVPMDHVPKEFKYIGTVLDSPFVWHVYGDVE